MNYEDWLKTVPGEITGDWLWRLEAYPLALFLSDLSWHDVTKLSQDKRTQDLSNQLYRATGSIGASIAEGYSRGTGRDRARFYEYALGSARETRDWYYKGRHVLSDIVSRHRLRLATQVIRLLLAMIPEQRDGSMRDEPAEYRAANPSSEAGRGVEQDELMSLLRNVPIP